MCKTSQQVRQERKCLGLTGDEVTEALRVVVHGHDARTQSQRLHHEWDNFRDIAAQIPFVMGDCVESAVMKASMCLKSNAKGKNRLVTMCMAILQTMEGVQEKHKFIRSRCEVWYDSTKKSRCRLMQSIISVDFRYASEHPSSSNDINTLDYLGYN